MFIFATAWLYFPTKSIKAFFEASVSGLISIVAVFSVLSCKFNVTSGITSSIVFVGLVIVIPSYLIIASSAVETAWFGENPRFWFSL